MSIIYETLSRLEKEGTGQADHLDRAGLVSLANRPMRSPARVRAMLMVLVLTGVGLALWLPNSPLSDFNQLPLANAFGGAVASEESDHDLSNVPPAEQLSHQIRPAGPKHETVTAEGQPAAAPLAQRSVEETAEFSGLQAKAVESPIGSQPQEETREVAGASPVEVEVAAAQPNVAPVVSEKPSARVAKVSVQAQPSKKAAAVTGAKVSLVDAPSAKPQPRPKPKLAVPQKQQAGEKVTGPGDAAGPNTVDGVIEQAGYALSRGRYQQALAVLEKLSPVPEHRVDYWLVKGNAYLRVGQLDSAEKALASAQRLAPGNAQIAVQLAILKQEKGEHVIALQILQDAGETNPDVPEIFLNKGYSEQALGAVQDARRSFRIFLRITEGRSLYTRQRKLVNEWLAQFPSTSN